MKPIIFIDGEAGTTGLQIHSRLHGRSDIQMLSLAAHERKIQARRSEALNSCDIAILCLPDEAAKEAVSFITNPQVRVLDASSGHRTTPGWVYGLPELDSEQPLKISKAKRVSNPGCYPTGAILLIHPLVASEVIPNDYPINVHAISGYSGSGRQLIDQYEDPSHPEHKTSPFIGYGLDLSHKHVPEMQKYSLLSHRPLFTPAYGKYKQGIVLYIPLHTRLLKSNSSLEKVHETLDRYYANSEYVNVQPLRDAESTKLLEPEILNNTNKLNIWIFGSKDQDQILLAAVYDNLGKGASGAAVQNLELMLYGLS